MKNFSFSLREKELEIIMENKILFLIIYLFNPSKLYVIIHFSLNNYFEVKKFKIFLIFLKYEKSSINKNNETVMNYLIATILMNSKK